MPYTHSESGLQIVHRQGRNQNVLLCTGRSHTASKIGLSGQLRIADHAFNTRSRYIETLSITLFLALYLGSGLVHADEIFLTRDANAALARKDYSGAFSKFAVLAQQGNAAAQFNVGAFYLNGQGVQKDEKQAIEWFAKSAAGGNARALQVLQSAAAKGNESAIYALNAIRQPTASDQTQTLTPSQPPRAVPEDEKALWLEANTALSQKDYNTAFPKFLALAQQGNSIAQFNMGAFYFNGQGVHRDAKLAYEWFAKSAAQGNARALEVMQSEAAKQNEKEQTKNTFGKPALATTATAHASKPDTEAKATNTASHEGLERTGESSLSNYSIGLNLGKVAKINGVNSSPAFGLRAGHKFNSSFGIEFAYSSLCRNANADTLLSATYPGTTGTFDLTSVSAVGQYTYDLSSNMSLLGNLGVHTSSYKLNSSGSGAKSGNSSGLVVGVKVQYELSKSVGIRGGFDTYAESGGMTGNLTEVGVEVIYKF